MCIRDRWVGCWWVDGTTSGVQLLYCCCTVLLLYTCTPRSCDLRPSSSTSLDARSVSSNPCVCFFFCCTAVLCTFVLLYTHVGWVDGWMGVWVYYRPHWHTSLFTGATSLSTSGASVPLLITKWCPVHPRQCMYSTEQRQGGAGTAHGNLGAPPLAR